LQAGHRILEQGNELTPGGPSRVAVTIPRRASGVQGPPGTREQYRACPASLRSGMRPGRQDAVAWRPKAWPEGPRGPGPTQV